jgi:hypothetical protein
MSARACALACRYPAVPAMEAGTCGSTTQRPPFASCLEGSSCGSALSKCHHARRGGMAEHAIGRLWLTASGLGHETHDWGGVLDPHGTLAHHPTDQVNATRIGDRGQLASAESLVGDRRRDGVKLGCERAWQGRCLVWRGIGRAPARLPAGPLRKRCAGALQVTLACGCTFCRSTRPSRSCKAHRRKR